MPIPSAGPLVSDRYLNDLTVRGQAIYESQLRSRLEPDHDNEYVVIHVDTEDYAVGKTFREAKQAMMARHPIDGRLFGRKIGPAPDNDAFVTRFLASELRADSSK